MSSTGTKDSPLFDLLACLAGERPERFFLERYVSLIRLWGWAFSTPDERPTQPKLLRLLAVSNLITAISTRTVETSAERSEVISLIAKAELEPEQLSKTIG